MTTSSNDTPIKTLLTTKLHIPQVASDLVHRPHLIDRLNRGLERKLTLISAPAGYGKTSLAAVWLRDSPRKVAWLSLDEGDGDLNVFLNYLVAAIRTVFPDACLQTEVLTNTSQIPSIDTIATTFLNEITVLHENFILVLDDFQTIRNDLIHELITELIHHLPSNMHLVLCSRTDPRVPIAKLRVYRQMTEIRITELSFSKEDINNYLEQVLDEKQSIEIVTLLEEKTEGWIAGIRLAAISMQESEDKVAFVKAFKGVHHNVMDFLMDEVLSRQSQTVQDFLFRTSIVERFTISLCEGLTNLGVRECQEHLDNLMRNNLFIISLDFERGWYRYHHLFQALLRRRLDDSLSEDEMAALHNRASEWLVENGFVEEGIKHSLAAQDMDGAADLIEENRHNLLNIEDWITLERWINLLPEETVHERPDLLIAKAWVMDLRFQIGAIPPLLIEAEKCMSDFSGFKAGNAVSLQGEIDALWSVMFAWQGRGDAALERASGALKQIPNERAFARSFAVLIEALAYQMIGQAGNALTALNEFLTEAGSKPNTVVARMMIGQAYVHLREGNLHQAAHALHQLQVVSEEARLTISLVIAHWLLGRIHYEWNHLEESRQHLEKVFELRYGGVYGMVFDSMLSLALTYQAQGDLDKAEGTLADLRQFTLEIGTMERLPDIASFEARLAILQGNVQSAIRWAETTPMEMPTGYTFVWLDLPIINKVRALIAKGTETSLDEAVRLLQELISFFGSRHNMYRQIELLSLLSMAYDTQAKEVEAISTLERSVALAESGGCVRTFVDSGPSMARMLNELASKGDWPEYIENVLSEFQRTKVVEDSVESFQRVSQDHLVEPLTKREHEVLSLLCNQLSDKEIADELSISVLTVKTHARNIYQKLDVKGRKQAVFQAKILGILPPD